MRLPNGDETLSVGDLRKALKGIPDNLPIEVFCEWTGVSGPDGYNIVDVQHHPASGISYEALAFHV